MRRFGIARLGVVPMMALLASCSVIDVPVSTASGSGIARGGSIALANELSTDNELNRRVRSQLEAELARTGYRISSQADYVMEFAIAKRPSSVGVLLPDSDTPKPEAGTWRSRPIDQGAFALCTHSIHRLMLVISRERTREIVFKGSSDDDSCGELTDDKLKTMVASSVAKLRERSIR